jgi:hypothetical protein
MKFTHPAAPEVAVSPRRSRFIAAAFDQGQIPTIACFNQATADLGVEFDRLITALQRFVDDSVVPVWGTPAKLVRSRGFKKGAWALAFLDRADVANALGYHDLTPDGFPLSKVFVQTTIEGGQQVSVTASHELVEMLVDPAINLCAVGPNGVFYAYETADPVEEITITVDRLPMTDFVYPSWFEDFRTAGSTRFDHARKVNRPFQILAGGYMSIFKNGRWTQIYGSKGKRRRMRGEARRTNRGRRTSLRRSRRP